MIGNCTSRWPRSAYHKVGKRIWLQWLTKFHSPSAFRISTPQDSTFPMFLYFFWIKLVSPSKMPGGSGYYWTSCSYQMMCLMVCSSWCWTEVWSSIFITIADTWWQVSGSVSCQVWASREYPGCIRQQLGSRLVSLSDMWHLLPQCRHVHDPCRGSQST